MANQRFIFKQFHGNIDEKIEMSSENIRFGRPFDQQNLRVDRRKRIVSKFCWAHYYKYLTAKFCCAKCFLLKTNSSSRGKLKASNVEKNGIQGVSYFSLKPIHLLSTLRGYIYIYVKKGSISRYGIQRHVW